MGLCSFPPAHRLWRAGADAVCIEHFCQGCTAQRIMPSCMTELTTICKQEGYGVNTFVFINDQGAEKLVKFHWRPTIGE